MPRIRASSLEMETPCYQGGTRAGAVGPLFTQQCGQLKCFHHLKTLIGALIISASVLIKKSCKICRKNGFRRVSGSLQCKGICRGIYGEEGRGRATYLGQRKVQCSLAYLAGVLSWTGSRVEGCILLSLPKSQPIFVVRDMFHKSNRQERRTTMIVGSNIAMSI